MAGSPRVMQGKEIRRAEFRSVGAVCGGGGQRFSRWDARGGGLRVEMRRSIRSAGECASRGQLKLGWNGGPAQSGARIGGGALDAQARNWAATAIVVRWSRRASLECLRTKAEVKANAIRRIKVTAARP